MKSLPQTRKYEPPSQHGDASFAQAQVGVARGEDALPVTLSERMYAAWPFERAKRFEPELEQMLAEKLASNNKAGFDKIVAQLNREFDEALREKTIDRRVRLGGSIGAAAAKMIGSIIPAVVRSWFW